ncbi:FAD/FMN-containing isoamyl alcohol oxidase MreA [Massariosphaeria phaeospora]|uniref:FAD/FMN-containing isoamyl alcohol oxidase MreA n=1 Tax=Massariosphaeria phaeospora TaxID=100035 RepID=A0A7C8MA29_9PLEO|nr:FAD/FMN-containing isoamyl alcohol oxidase MreA [Massariosphaeria phaeospora]
MHSHSLPNILFLVTIIPAVAIGSYAAPQCRTIPEDASWPAQSAWRALNESVDGRLISVAPIAAPCHTTLFGQPNPEYDSGKCDILRNTWFLPETHLTSSSSAMAYPFSNNSCSPFLGPDLSCNIGFHNSYAINASGAVDFQKAIAFVKEHNIRLTIRNTGHDYLGKSTGAHSLAIWTHYMKDIKLIPQYKSLAYSGPAIELHAGVEVHEAYAFADANRLVVVGGNCPTVGIAGGYSQGGGHGPFASKFGLAADQVLEWQLVTSAGELITATPFEYPDLFWALRGGGGSTYGAVVSMTVKAFPDMHVSTAHITLLKSGTNADALYDVVRTFLKNLPKVVDRGVMVTWIAAPFGFMVSPAFAPGLHKEELDSLLKPTVDKLKKLNLTYQYSSTEFNTFLSGYKSLPNSWNVSDYNLGGRLIPRSLVEQDLESILSAIRYISENAFMSGVSFNAQHGVSDPDEVGVNPYMRQSLFNIAVGTPINYTDWSATKAAQDRITNDLLPRLEKLTPNGGAYLNEADFQAPDFKSLFYGAHYDMLESIKARYDPLDMFYAKTAVGSDRWTQQANGRLCRTAN